MNENERKLIKEYQDKIDELDEKIKSNLKERLKLNENFIETIFKNSLEHDKDIRNIKYSILFNSSNNEIINYFKDIKYLEKSKYIDFSKKFKAKYLYIGKSVPKLAEFIFKEFTKEEIYNIDIYNNEIEKLLYRDSVNGYFLDSCNNMDIFDKLDNATNQSYEIGELNLIQKYKNRNFGFNTIYYGLMKLIKKYGFDFNNKNVLIIGKNEINSIKYTLEKLNAKLIYNVDLYDLDNIDSNNINIIINTINFDNNFNIKLDKFTSLEFIIDLCKDDIFSRLYLEAINNNITIVSGHLKELYQIKKAIEILFKSRFDDYIFEKILKDYMYKNLNIVLVGMPGAGKTTVGRIISKKLKRKHIDLDREFYYEYGISAQDYLSKYDEKSFREKEKLIVERIGDSTGVVISTSGGVVSKIENYYHLKKNSIIFMIERDLNNLSTKNRPLSQGGINTLRKMKKDRLNNYLYFTDYIFENKGNFNEVAYKIINKFFDLEVLK